MGLIEKKREDQKVVYYLTEKGSDLFNLPISKRQIEFVKLILSHLVFRKTLELYFIKSAPPNTDEIIALMKSSNLYHIKKDTTFHRRSKTISGWIRWIFELIEE